MQANRDTGGIADPDTHPTQRRRSMPTRNGSAEWRGDLQGGDGTLKVGDHSYEGPYTFKSRFEEGEGTNPEELIGAANAACYSMQLSAMLAQDGHTVDSVNTVAKVHLRMVDGKPTITLIELETEGKVPGVDDETFQSTAAAAKEACLVSRALAAVPESTLKATLLS
jgi:lipoyl-dependent peroxiredoxin